MFAASTVVRETRSHIALLTLNRPEAGNRLDTATLDELAASLRGACRDDGIRSVVITGAGEQFCTGGEPPPSGSGGMAIREFGRAWTDVADATMSLSKPLIAAVNGDALAGGFGLLAMCDLAVASEDAMFGLPEIRAGRFPILALATVVHSFPSKTLFEMIYDGREYSASEARELGFVNRIAPRARVLQEALAWASQIGAHEGNALAVGRSTYYEMRQMSGFNATKHAVNSLVTLLMAGGR